MIGYWTITTIVILIGAAVVFGAGFLFGFSFNRSTQRAIEEDFGQPGDMAQMGDD